jgi:hypothetical protein
MNRRAFFGLIGAGLAAAADPERLLWVPGRKLISIPKPYGTMRSEGSHYVSLSGITWDGIADGPDYFVRIAVRCVDFSANPPMTPGLRPRCRVRR